ncbi:hypothetical protein [Arthrobacter sp. UYEF3]|uniref:hypothetical protein n=1 Tax=Arthrobacter sp. UYEF3 TaxID=1756365 RepID=UPI003396F45E
MMTERAEFDATKNPESFGMAEPYYSQRWPDGVPWPDSSEHRQALLPVLPLPRTRMGSPENTMRGTLFAVAVIPVGVGLWMILWKLGWMTSIVAFLTAAGAARLYLAGSMASGSMASGSMSRRGARVVVAVTAATVLLSFLGGIWLHLTTDFTGALLMALLFGALGCFVSLRPAGRARRG